MIVETHGVGRNAYPSEKKVDSPCYRKNLSSDSEIAPNGVFQLKGRLQRAEKLVIPFSHSFIQQTFTWYRALRLRPSPFWKGSASIRRERHK